MYEIRKKLEKAREPEPARAFRAPGPTKLEPIREVQKSSEARAQAFGAFAEAYSSKKKMENMAIVYLSF